MSEHELGLLAGISIAATFVLASRQAFATVGLATAWRIAYNRRMRIHIVTGNRRQFHDCLRKLGVHEKAAVCVEHPDQLAGAERVLLYGDYGANPAAPAARALLESRRAA